MAWLDTLYAGPACHCGAEHSVGPVGADDPGAGLVHADPAASSVDPNASLRGPITPKDRVELIGDGGVWGWALDKNPALQWRPLPSATPPHRYEQHFMEVAAVTDVALRFWGLPMD